MLTKSVDKNTKEIVGKIRESIEDSLEVEFFIFFNVLSRNPIMFFNCGLPLAESFTRAFRWVYRGVCGGGCNPGKDGMKRIPN